MAQMKEQIKTPYEELNKMETSKLLDAKLKTLVIRMLKEFNENLNSIKKIQSETKDTLIKLKNNLQVINNRVDEAENKISDLQYKEAKNNQSEQQEGERIQKIEDSVSSLQAYQLLHYGGPRRERKNKKLETCLKK